MRFLSVVLLGAFVLNGSLVAAKQKDNADISKIEQMTQWVRSWRFPTKEDIRKVLRFLSHEEYVICLKNPEKCSWKKVAVLVVLDMAIIAAISKGIKILLEDDEETRFDQSLKIALKVVSPELAIQLEKYKKERDKIPHNLPDEFTDIHKIRSKIREWFDILKARKVEGKDINVEDDLFLAPYFYGNKKGLSLIGIIEAIGVAASYLLGENKKQEFINQLKEEGAALTEKDKLMIELTNWEKEQEQKERLYAFIGATRPSELREKHKKEGAPELPELHLDVLKKHIKSYLLPELTGSVGKQEED